MRATDRGNVGLAKAQLSALGAASGHISACKSLITEITEFCLSHTQHSEIQRAMDVAFVVSCSVRPQPPHGVGGSNDSKHSLSKRPAMVGAVPLYYLMRAGRHIRDAFEHNSATPTLGVGDRLREAATDAAEELVRRDVQIGVLQARIAALEEALATAEGRLARARGGEDTAELRRTLTRFERAMHAAAFRATRAERDADALGATCERLQSDVFEREADAVKAVLLLLVLGVVAATSVV